MIIDILWPLIKHIPLCFSLCLPLHMLLVMMEETNKQGRKRMWVGIDMEGAGKKKKKVDGSHR